MKLEISAKTIKEWLECMHLTRQELAGLLKVAKSTVDGWCAGRPLKKSIRDDLLLLMLEQELQSIREQPDGKDEQGFHAEPSLFTPAEWQTICQAARLKGITPAAFMRQAVYMICDNIFEEESRRGRKE